MLSTEKSDVLTRKTSPMSFPPETLTHLSIQQTSCEPMTEEPQSFPSNALRETLKPQLSEDVGKLPPH